MDGVNYARVASVARGSAPLSLSVRPCLVLVAVRWSIGSKRDGNRLNVVVRPTLPSLPKKNSISELPDNVPLLPVLVSYIFRPVCLGVKLWPFFPPLGKFPVVSFLFSPSPCLNPTLSSQHNLAKDVFWGCTRFGRTDDLQVLPSYVH